MAAVLRSSQSSGRRSLAVGLVSDNQKALNAQSLQ